MIDDYIRFDGPKLLVRYAFCRPAQQKQHRATQSTSLTRNVRAPRYKDLLLAPEQTVQRIASFLGPDVVQEDKLEYMINHAAELVCFHAHALCQRVDVETCALFALILLGCRKSLQRVLQLDCSNQQVETSTSLRLAQHLRTACARHSCERFQGAVFVLPLRQRRCAGQHGSGDDSRRTGVAAGSLNSIVYRDPSKIADVVSPHHCTITHTALPHR